MLTCYSYFLIYLQHHNCSLCGSEFVEECIPGLDMGHFDEDHSRNIEPHAIFPNIRATASERTAPTVPLLRRLAEELEALHTRLEALGYLLPCD